MLRTMRREWQAMKTRTTVISSFAISRSRRWQWWAWLWHEFRMWREHDLPPPRWLVLETSSQALTRQHRRLTIWILGNMGWQDPYDITDTEARCLECLHSSHLMTNWGRACPHCAPEQAVCHLWGGGGGGGMRRFLFPRMKHIMPYDLAAWLWKWMKFFKLSFFIFSLSSLQILWHKVSYRRTGRTSISISKNAL